VLKIRKFLPLAIAGISAFIALSAWAFASPPGSAPDDDFHLPAIWCSHGAQPGICDPKVAGDGYGDTPSPLSPSAICFAFKSDVSAACQSTYFDWKDKNLDGSRTNEKGRFPNGFYWTLHFLIGDNTLNSAMMMRIFNSFLAVSLIVLTFAFATPRVRVGLIGSWIAVSVPLAMFTIPSTNPSSWSIIGIGTYWAALLSFLRSDDKKRLVVTGVLTFITGLISIQSRSEASPYLLLSTFIVLLVGVPIRNWFKFDKKYLLPLFISVLALYEFLTTPSSLGWSTGLPGGDPNRSSSELWFRNISEWPTFITGSLGGWPLGWLDVPMPSITYFFAMFTFSGILISGIAYLNSKKTISLLLIFAALFILPLRILALGKNYVGENVQPRYFLPLLFLLVGIALFSPKNVDSFWLSPAQVGATFVSVSIAHGFALHFALRRYITGSDVVDWNLNKNVEWWWDPLPSPMTWWAIGSFAFSLAVLIGLLKIRKPVTTDL